MNNTPNILKDMSGLKRQGLCHFIRQVSSNKKTKFE